MLDFLTCSVTWATVKFRSPAFLCSVLALVFCRFCLSKHGFIALMSKLWCPLCPFDRHGWSASKVSYLGLFAFLIYSGFYTASCSVYSPLSLSDLDIISSDLSTSPPSPGPPVTVFSIRAVNSCSERCY